MPPTLESLRHRREELAALAARHGARALRIFGSVARGDADSRSDVDFLVDFEPGRSLFDQADLLVALEDLLGVRVDVVTEAALRRRVRERVLREAVARLGDAIRSSRMNSFKPGSFIISKF
jgi:predicted nucleotidyltransferase